MSLAQKLYEGIDIGTETTGLITYMRTDSTRLSADFTRPAMKYIEEEFGKDYVGHVKQAKEKDNVQDAHEAIRPTSVLREPTKIKQYLSSDEFKLYSLIYKRAIASLMADAILDQTTVILDNNGYTFKTTGSIIIFDGYLKVYGDYESKDDKVIPDFKVGEEKVTSDVEKKRHETQPKPRYTEATLIKELEEKGIGRPSTYATIIDTIKSHDYVVLKEKKFYPTDMGCETNDKLQEFFSDLINTDYTSNMETDLDKVAEGKEDKVKLLREFWTLFEPRVQTSFKEMEKKGPEETGEICPECGSPLVLRKSKYGEFTACSNYPTCKYIKSDKEPEEVIEVCDCPNCSGKIIVRKSRKGKVFYGCNNYPKCKTAYWDKPIDKKCPKCGNMLTEKNNQVKCSNCDYEE